MMSVNKQHIIDTLVRLQQAQPTLRLGQVISNSIPSGKDLFYLEDAELMRCLHLAFRDIQPTGFTTQETE